MPKGIVNGSFVACSLKEEVMKTSKLGLPLILSLPIINTVLWMVIPTETFPSSATFPNQFWAEILASAGMILIGIALILAARPKFLEGLFGGLDKMYKGHKLASILGLWLIVMHKFTIPESGDEGLGPKLGMLGLIGFVVLVALTLLSNKMKYNTWKKSHKLIGVFFVVGIAHTFLVDNLLQYATLPSILTRVISFIAVFAYLYQEVLRHLITPNLKYKVAEVKRLNSDVVELAMTPNGKALSHNAGQFLSIKLNKAPLNEFHPFTISSAPNSDRLKLTIKACGDFTKKLYDTIETGDTASIQGPYGKLDYTMGTDKQVWVAGGIGITPFLSWLRNMKVDEAKQIDFFYTVRSLEEAIFLEELEAAGDSIANLNFHLWLSNDQGHINAEAINKLIDLNSNTSAYLCGPIKMTQSLSKQLTAKGVRKANVHFEEFNFK